jgi:hypothetical protein
MQYAIVFLLKGPLDFVSSIIFMLSRGAITKSNIARIYFGEDNDLRGRGSGNGSNALAPVLLS